MNCSVPILSSQSVHWNVAVSVDSVNIIGIKQGLEWQSLRFSSVIPGKCQRLWGVLSAAVSALFPALKCFNIILIPSNLVWCHTFCTFPPVECGVKKWHAKFLYGDDDFYPAGMHSLLITMYLDLYFKKEKQVWALGCTSCLPFTRQVHIDAQIIRLFVSLVQLRNRRRQGKEMRPTSALHKH